MSSKRKMTEEEDEHSKDNFWKKLTRYKPAKRKQKFKIHYTEFLTDANRERRKKTSATLELNEDTTEEEIRNSLISELSQLKDQNFRFFTKDKEGKLYYCPCKPKCDDNHFKAEWNARNIAKVVKEDRPVHIFIEGVSESDESSSGYSTTVLPDNHRSPDPLEEEVRGAGSLVDFLTNEVSSEPQLEIKEIVPQEGNVEGGYTFYLELKEHCADGFKVQFGETDPIDVQRIDEMTYRGKVPASSNAGVVEVKIVQTLANVKNTIAFTYIDEDLEKKPDIEEQLKFMDEAELQELLIATAKQFGEMNLKSNEEKTRYGDSGGDKNHSLPLLRMISDTAARINAIEFFEILFRSHVGCTLFRSFKDCQPPLEEIARLNGHTELALMLEEKHLLFRDDENDSDDEVDWKEIYKKIGEYQAKRDELVEKWSLQSTDSSNNVHGYLADRENSLSTSSLQVSVAETCNEENEMGGDHKFLKGKIKLVFRSCSEPAFFPFEDKFGRNWTTFSHNEVERLRKKITSCSTQHIDDIEACCRSLPVEDLDEYPKTTKITTERKSFLQTSERKELQRLPDHHNLCNPRFHLDVVCSSKNSHIADTPLCCEKKYPVEIDERLPCVYVNDSSTESSPNGHSSPLNKGGGKLQFFRMCCKVTLILSVFTIIAIGIAFGLKVGGHKTSFTPTPLNPCKKTQHWVENADDPPQCIDCQACPPGQTISPECGNSKPLTPDTAVFCVSCQLGKSFSSEYSTSACMPCSSCSKDQVVIKNCTYQADIECGKKCYGKDRYYDESRGDCLRCSKCCNDDRDVVESECIEKLGSQSSMICSFHSSVNRCNIKSTPKIEPQSTNESSHSSAATTSSHIVTVALTNTSANVGYRLENITHSGRFASKSKDCNDSCKSITVTVVILFLVGGIYLTRFCKLRSPMHSCVDPDGGTHKKKSTKVHYNSGLAAVELCEPLLEGDGKLCTSACHNAEQLVKSDSKPIGSLLDSSELETICELLDTPIGGKLAYEIIARFYGANYFKIKARFQDQKSKAVIEWLATERPELTVWEFANVVRREAGRTDVANRLKAFDAKATKELTDV